MSRALTGSQVAILSFVELSRNISLPVQLICREVDIEGVLAISIS